MRALRRHVRAGQQEIKGRCEQRAGCQHQEFEGADHVFPLCSYAGTEGSLEIFFRDGQLKRGDAKKPLPRRD